MAPQRRKPSLPIYLVPIVFGLCGILFATQLQDSPLLKVLVLLISLGGPLLAVGMLLARLSASRFERFAMVVGIVLLALGALGSVSEFWSMMVRLSDFSQVTLNAWRWVGLASLVLGLFAIVFILVRRDEHIEEVAERFRYLADHMSEGFILTGPDGSVTLVNDALLQMTGLTADALIGKDGRNLAEIYELEPMLKHMDMRSRGVASEYRLTWTRMGVERQLWVSGTPLFDSRGGFTGALATVRDVTEQHLMSKRLERYAQGLQELVEDRTEKLEQSRHRLRDLLFHMKEAFVTVDEAYRITFANERFLELIHEETDAVAGKDLFDYVEVDARGRLLDLFAKPTPAQELTLQSRNGSEVQVVVSITTVEPSPDSEERYSLVMTDIRELLRMQQQLEGRARELEEANAELRMLDRAKDNFLSTVSHELRTPLSTVRGYTEMLESASLGQLAPPQSNALAVMSRNIERLEALINEMLEFSRMEVRGIALHQTLFAGAEMLQETAASMEPQMRARDIHMTINASPDASIIWGDRRRLLQALSIFLANAVKFCSPGDIITLGVERRVGGTIAISVADTGIGIDPIIQRRVFDKFYQADSSLSRRYEGAGIGLSIAKAIAEAHGGHIDLQSDPGKGSTFTIILPQSSFTPADPESEHPIHGSQSVLLAIAEMEFSDILKDVLEARGFSIIVAASGMACLREAKQKLPALLIVDDVLPDLGGQATIKGLQSDLDGVEIPTLLMVGDEQARRPEESGQRDTHSVLYKPFTTDEFMERVAQALSILPNDTGALGTRRRARRGSDANALVITQDADILEWVSTALRSRRMRCATAENLDVATAAAQLHTPRIVVIEAETAGDDSDILMEGARSLAGEYGAHFVVLTTGLLGDTGGGGCKIVRIPCSTRELLEGVSIVPPVMA
ncbi:MAG: ATP-binding protein [Candidatus Hydrogenedentes bacterium]|nr:ATP-binding protein [Candidatus Hydrogenedentota bacterium]